MSRLSLHRLTLAGVPLALLAACGDAGNPTNATDRQPPVGPLAAKIGMKVTPLSAGALQDDDGVLVALRTLGPGGTVPAEVAKAIEAAGGRIARFDRASKLVVAGGLTSADALGALGSVDVVTENLEHQIQTDQSGAGLYGSLQQNLPHINVPAAWANTQWNGANTRVCIIDSGVDDSHPDLAGKVVADTNFVNADPARNDGNAHGTHVGSTVSSNGIGSASVAPGAVLLNARVFNSGGGGATTDRVVAAIRWCGRQGAHVINMSLGFNGGLVRGVPNTIAIVDLEQAAINDVLNGTDPTNNGTGGAILVASAGNDGARIPSPHRIWVPAELNNVIAVGSTLRAADTRSSFTNRGRSVDIYAPGSSILAVCSTFSLNCGGAAISTFNGARYMLFSGTSMAAPTVAGVTSLVYSSYGGVRSAANAAKVVSCVLGRALTNRVAQLPDAGGRRADAFLAQTGRSAGAAACPN